MAFFPCAAGPHVHARKNFLLYVGWGRGSDIRRYKLRFCSTHYALIQEDLAQFKVSPGEGAAGAGDVVPADCLSCGKPVDEVGWQLFATGYPPNDEREDYWAHIHVDCRLPDLLREPDEVSAA